MIQYDQEILRGTKKCQQGIEEESKPHQCQRCRKCQHHQSLSVSNLTKFFAKEKNKMSENEKRNHNQNRRPNKRIKGNRKEIIEILGYKNVPITDREIQLILDREFNTKN